MSQGSTDVGDVSWPAPTAADLMTKPQLLKEARAEFLESTIQGYDCPIGKEVTF